MTAARSVTATFNVQTFTLTTSKTGTGTGSVTGAGTYSYGTVVNVTEAPGANSTFTGWSGACSGTGACSVTMTANRTVTGGFDLIPETLTVSSPAGGTLSTSPAGIDCAGGNIGTCSSTFGHGTLVTVIATPDVGARLGLWGGACSGTPITSLTCTVTMDQARSVSVRWAPQQFAFSLTFPGDVAGTVTINGTQYTTGTSFTVSYGQTLTMTETTSGLFYGWGGACASQGTNSSCTLTVTGDTDVSATFHSNAYRNLLVATTANPNAIAFEVTAPTSATTTAECTSSSTGQNCYYTLPTGMVVTLVAHLPTATSFQPVWNTLPTWTGCDTVSADRLKCTYTVVSVRQVTVSGDVRAAP